jgi:dinuclear metal center YbgI/SA1388 family protein
MKTEKLYKILDDIAPFSSAEEWDNSGLLIGAKSKNVKKIGIVLDIDLESANYAKDNGFDLLISHHPIIFDLDKVITPDSAVAFMRKNKISAIALHTNMDRTGLINKALAKKLNLKYIEDIKDGYGIVCELPKKMSASNFAKYIKDKLKISGLSYCGKKSVKRIAVSSGSAFDDCDRAILQGCDGIITSDVKHNCFVEAKDKDFATFCVDHYDTEIFFCKELYKALKDRLDENTELQILPQKPYCKHI